MFWYSKRKRIEIMREIKFRAWNKITNHFSDFTNEHRISDINSSELMIFMQYTGLKDKNGVEIYEGDIVKHTYWFCNRLYTDIYRVEFLNGSFILRKEFENIINKEFQEVDYGLEIEVIGNIYENPELLQEGI